MRVSHPCRLPPSLARGPRGPPRAEPTRSLALRSRSPRVQPALPRAAADSAPTPAFKLRLPIDANDQVDQAAASVTRAWAAGATRASVRLLLPATGATDIDDFPGGTREQSGIAIPLVERMLTTMKKVEGLQGRLDVSVLDRAEGTAAWTSPALACILLPTAETLKACEAYAADRDARNGLTLLVNPAWTLGGNIIGDFGIGYWRVAAEKRVAFFQLAYALDALRVAGDDIRLLYLTDAGWSVWLLADGKQTLLAEGLPDRPTAAAITDLLKDTPGTAAGASLVDRLKREIGFLKDTM